MEIAAGYDGDGEQGRNFTGPMMKFKTSKRVGLGTTISKVPKRYPDAVRYTTGTVTNYFIPGKGKDKLFFQRGGPDDSQIQSIYVSNNQCVPRKVGAALPHRGC